MSREELQKQALSLINNQGRVALQWCTGLGKSRAAIEIANYLDLGNPFFESLISNRISLKINDTYI